ncbi:MAG: hypothetical protein AAB495_04680 [Patescibacteria group bacterium]
MLRGRTKRLEKAIAKQYDPRRLDIYMLATRRLRLIREGKKWAILYKGPTGISGLVPDFMGVPGNLTGVNPVRVYAQIRGALVDFAISVLKANFAAKK